jgi:F-type H+-transporting ATPase subunit epsilon
MLKSKVSIISAERVILENAEADYVIVPTTRDYIKILPHHTHIIEKISGGIVKISCDGNDEHYTIFNGICKVLKDKIIILVEISEHKDDIDIDRAQKALDKATKQLENTIDMTEEKYNSLLQKKLRASKRLQLALSSE